MSAPPPPPPSRPSNADASSSTQDSRWKRWSKTAFDKSIVVSDWASGYANSASAKMGGERFWPKSNDFPEEITKCERILRAFTVEGIESKPAASADKEGADAAETIVEHDPQKNSFIHKKRKVLRKIPPSVIKRAKGIVIYTAMRSGIAPFGGAGGAGLMLARLPDGSWSAPSSISPNNLAVGLLLGFDIFDVILVVNSERAMESFKSHKVTLGAETAVAAGPFGTGISGEMGIDRSPVFSYVRSRGLYGGVEAMAQAFLHRFDENERIYYWPGVTARDILEGKVRKPPLVDPLYRALRDAETGVAQGDSLERTVYETVKAPPNVAVRQLQQEESAELLEDGERLKLPPTPEELEAMEEAGIPDDFDLELERKQKEEEERRKEEERREIRALPPPPKHKKVVGYWESRGSKPGEKRRMAPSPLQLDGSGKEENEIAEEKMDLIDLDEPSKPPLPPRPAQEDGVDGLADELDSTNLTDVAEAPDDATKVAALDGEPVSLLAPTTSTTEATAIPTTPRSAVPADLTNSADSLSRSTSLTRPSRPPRRAAAATPRAPTTTTSSLPSSSPTASAPLHIFFDWDETITSHDTLSLIAPPEQTHPGPPFSHYTSAYLADLETFESSFGPRRDWAAQLEFLDRMDAVERASVSRVEEGRLFQGMSKSSLLARAEKVQFRDGWDEFYTWLSNQALDADIISVGWSASFIRHAIEHRSHPGGIREIYANEVEMIDDIGTGNLTKSSTTLPATAIRTGLDKLRVMQSSSSTTSAVTVYVGDSATDLPCLLNAHFGLIMNPNFDGSSIHAIIQQTNPPFRKLYTTHEEFLQSHESATPSTETEEHKSVLIKVDDWVQAMAVIQHIQTSSL